jgi:ubiquinone/menaquinone biosynthesis C-methylase UbiE
LLSIPEGKSAMRGRTAAIAAFLSAVCAGCQWSGFGFRADGAEMPRLRQELAIQAGSAVADVGAGQGGLTFALATEVGPNGRVFSTEIDPGRLRALREAVVAARLDNVTVVEALAGETGLPPSCCDAIVLRRVYHHLAEPSDINASLLRSLRPGGLLAVIDFAPPFFFSRGSFGVPTETVISEVTSRGFKLVRRIDDWPGRGPLGSYCVVFRKP